MKDSGHYLSLSLHLAVACALLPYIYIVSLVIVHTSQSHTERAEQTAGQCAHR